MIQLSESLANLGNSRIRHEKLAETQQLKMAKLVTQTQKAIQHRHDTNHDMKKQQRWVELAFCMVAEVARGC